MKTVSGIHRKRGYWLEAVAADTLLISYLATELLTHVRFFLLQSKIEVVEGPAGDVVASAQTGDMFSYGYEGCQGTLQAMTVSTRGLGSNLMPRL